MTKSFNQAGFPTPTRGDWLARVDATLKGGDFTKRLVTQTDDGIAIDPLGGAWIEVGAEWPGQAPFTRGTRAQPTRPAPWAVGQTIGNSDPQRANVVLREALAQGVMSVDLLIAEAAGAPGIAINSTTDLRRVLDGVFLEAVPVRLEAGARSLATAALLVEVWERQGIAAGDRAGSFGIDPIGTLARRGWLARGIEDDLAEAAVLARDVSGFGAVEVLLADTRAYHGAGATEAQELAIALATAVAYLRALERHGFGLEEATRLIGFVLTADADVMTTIAKFRAARPLWARVTAACGIPAQRARIRAETAARMITRRDPWVNMLRATAASFAAAVGGAEAIIVTPFSARIGLPDDFALRMARNTQLMLQEESGIGRVADPAGGAWGVEALTERLAQAAWKIFQEIERDGGIIATLKTGMIQRMIAAEADARALDYAYRRRLLTGVSAFPKLDETVPKVAGEVRVQEPGPIADAPALQVIALRARALGEDFEALRDQSDIIFAATGLRPAIFLANLGRLSDFNVRATWARNLFEAGGIEVRAGQGDTAQAIAVAFGDSRATIAILCSSDGIYDELAVPTTAALKAAGAVWVALAGRPGEKEAAFRAAGIDGFTHEGADVLATLRKAYDVLGKGGA